MVRHVHRVAPLDIFPRVHDYFLENYDWSPEEGRGGFSPTETKNFSLSLYISFLETSTKRRPTVTGRALSGEFRWKTPGQAIVGGGRKRRGGD